MEQAALSVLAWIFIGLCATILIGLLCGLGMAIAESAAEKTETPHFLKGKNLDDLP